MDVKEFKKNGLVERIARKSAGICETCANLVHFVNRDVLACSAHDKLILPKYPPYIHEHTPCKDWKQKQKPD